MTGLSKIFFHMWKSNAWVAWTEPQWDPYSAYESTQTSNNEFHKLNYL